MTLQPAARRPAPASGPGAVRRLAAVAALAALPLATGCSTDTHTFYSTPTAPKSVNVRYVQSGESAWSMDIPEGHTLTLNFNRPGEGFFRPMPDRPAEVMKWKLKQKGTGTDDRGRPVDEKQNDSGKVELNGLPVQMDVSLRTDSGRAASGRMLEPTDSGEQ